MNRSLRKRHARIWMLLWPILILGILMAIKMRMNAPPSLPNTSIGDSQ